MIELNAFMRSLFILLRKIQRAQYRCHRDGDDRQNGVDISQNVMRVDAIGTQGCESSVRSPACSAAVRIDAKSSLPAGR